MAKSGQGYWGSITDKGALYLAQKGLNELLTKYSFTWSEALR